MKTLDTKLPAERDIIKEAEKIISQANNNSNIRSNEKNTTKRKKVILLLLLTILILAFLISSFIFALITSKSDKIISGVSINGVDVSNLTKTEALQKLNLQLSRNTANEIKLNHNDYTTTLKLSDIEASFDFDSSLDEAYNIGRCENNIFANNKKVISTFLKKNNILPNTSYNSDKLNDEITKINNELPDKVVNSSYQIENNNLIVSNSSNGNRISTDSFTTNLKNCIVNNITSMDIPVEQFEADTVDIESIYNEIHKDPVNAYYSTNPYEIHKEENGLDFAITLDKAKEMINQKQDTYTIPLKTLTPKVTVKTLPQEAFPDLLATYSTSFATSNYNRSTNISLATQAVNGYVLMPGETFSYNTTVGQRTAARGYKEAGVYVNGAVTTGIGGGICQVSSTLYNAVLRCNLEIVDRSNHTFEPSYVPAGLDATVSWQSPDFKFKNNRNYPIKISASSAGKQIVFNIYGLKTSDDYEVKLVSSKIATIPFSTEYKDDNSLPAGTTKVLQGGSNGCKTQTYKILYKNGTEVSRTLINSDTYKPHNQVVARGTKVVQTPSVEPTTPTEPSTSSDSSVTITDVPAE